MVFLKIRTQVPAAPAQVFEYVTAYSTDGQADGRVNQRTLENKYGRLLEREGNTYTFLESIGGGITWRCTFEPTSHRAMRTVDSNWSDRLDWFEPAPGGTKWTIAWELKVSGAAICTKWLFFHLLDKRRVRTRLIIPVLLHFHRLRVEQRGKWV
jgi:hypothetical protein